MPDDYEYVDGIEVLSKLCDERGLEHWDSEAMACETHIFVDKAGNPHECWEAPDGMVNVVISMSPEQAVELGRGTCRADETDTLDCVCDGIGRYGQHVTVHVMECSACGGTYEHVNGAYEFCPRCGRKVVDA